MGLGLRSQALFFFFFLFLIFFYGFKKAWLCSGRFSNFRYTNHEIPVNHRLYQLGMFITSKKDNDFCT